jgi:hypothetical protein
VTPPSPTLVRVVAVTLTSLALAAVAAWTLLAVVHAQDRFLVDHVAGVRMALARYAQGGLLFPPLYDGERYGGTRFMPVPVVLHAAAATVTGEYLFSGKLLGYVFMLGLAAVAGVVLLRSQCPPVFAFGLVALLFVGQPGLAATFGMRVDTLPALVQLAAVAVVATTAGAVGAAAAAVLCLLAVASKLTAVWGAIAVLIWLSFADRRRLTVFAATYGVGAVALLMILHVVSDGRFAENIFNVSLSAGSGDIVRAPSRLLHHLVSDTPLVWAMLPIGVFATAAAFRHRAVSIYHVAFLVQPPLLLFLFTDVGVGFNQFVDLAALTVVVIGLYVAHQARVSPPTWHATVTGLLVVWLLVSGGVVHSAPRVRAAVGEFAAGEPVAVPPLAEHVTAETSLLSEDPTVPVMAGQDPVVLDPFMLLRLDRRRPEAVDDLVARIDAGEFQLVVLIRELDDTEWWGTYHFGPRVIAAIRGGYRPMGTQDGYHLYEPR